MVAEPLVDVRCAVCGGEEHAVICSAWEVGAHQEYLRRFHRRRLRRPREEALADRADFTQDYATDIVACAGCRLVFRNPRPSDEAIRRAYAQDEYGAERLAALFDSQVELHRPRARRLARRLGPEAKVVEVGSFVGGFLQAGREAGMRMLGVDPGREVDRFCAARGLRVFRGALPDLTPDHLPEGWAHGGVDCVAVWNAFDQLPDAEPTLTAARRLLRKGGVLALRVPNGECFRLAARWMRRLPAPLDGWLRALMAWNNLLAFPYLHGYSVRTLDWLLSWHGFERVTATPDVLCRLADDQTKTWAACEEGALKAIARCAGQVDAAWLGYPRIAPWLDAYYCA
jgi:SAM-dependent methyltransferase